MKLMANDNRIKLNTKTAHVFKVRGVSQCAAWEKPKLGIAYRKVSSTVREVFLHGVMMTADEDQGSPSEGPYNAFIDFIHLSNKKEIIKKHIFNLLRYPTQGF